MKLILITATLAWALTLPSAAQEGAEAQLAQARANEQRVRDTLRATTQQLRAAESEKASLLAGQNERDRKIADLEAQLAKVTRQSADDAEAARRTLTRLTTDVQRQHEDLARLKATLDKWKAAYTQASNLVKKGDAARSRLESANLSLERTVADRERQNLALYQTGAEILQRYSDFSLGRALTAREPFTGLARARLEEQIQDYADRLHDTKLKPAPSDGKPSTVPAPAGRAP